MNVNELLPQELHKLEFERIKKVNYVLGLKMVIWQQIKLKRDHYLLLTVVINIYCL